MRVLGEIGLFGHLACTHLSSLEGVRTKTHLMFGLGENVQSGDWQTETQNILIGFFQYQSLALDLPRKVIDAPNVEK